MAPSLGSPDFPTLCGHLNRHGVEYLVIGGWAAIIHGLPRTTLDVDIFIRPTEANAGRVIAALSEIGFGIARDLTTDEILGRSVLPFADQLRVDIFTRPWGLGDYDACAARAVRVEFEGVAIPVVHFDDLLASKATDRPQDRADADALRQLRTSREGRC
jgi:hypothetical protein